MYQTGLNHNTLRTHIPLRTPSTQSFPAARRHNTKSEDAYTAIDCGEEGIEFVLYEETWHWNEMIDTALFELYHEVSCPNIVCYNTTKYTFMHIRSETYRGDKRRLGSLSPKQSHEVWTAVVAWWVTTCEFQLLCLCFCFLWIISFDYLICGLFFCIFYLWEHTGAWAESSLF